MAESGFNRILTLLRKEKGITQKEAAAALGVSQALLSHYEKGIRECGLDFIVKVADFYEVSCDYLLGRSPDRSGLTLTVDELPEGDAGKDGKYNGSILPTLNKKLITNSVALLFDLLSKNPDKNLVSEISSYLMLAVYKTFRIIFSSNATNKENMFSVPSSIYSGYVNAHMSLSETNAKAILKGEKLEDMPPIKSTEEFALSTEKINKDYPLYASSLYNLIKQCEHNLSNK